MRGAVLLALAGESQQEASGSGLAHRVFAGRRLASSAAAGADLCGALGRCLRECACRVELFDVQYSVLQQHASLSRTRRTLPPKTTLPPECTLQLQLSSRQKLSRLPVGSRSHNKPSDRAMHQPVASTNTMC
jgi:hypothetical protein